MLVKKKDWEEVFDGSNADLETDQTTNIVEMPEGTIGSGVRIGVTAVNKGNKVCL